jgi:hypothetical protein
MNVRTGLVIAVIGTVGFAGCASPDKAAGQARPPVIGTDTTVVAAAGPKPWDHFGDGTFEVLTDIKPGKYKTAGAPPGQPPCYWARLKDLQGQVTSNIATGYGNQGPDIVMIEPGDTAFTTRGCGVWRRQP